VELVRHGLAEEAVVWTPARAHHADELDVVAEVLAVGDQRPVGIGEGIEIRLPSPRRSVDHLVALLRGRSSHLAERRAVLDRAGEIESRVLALADCGGVEPAHHGVLGPQRGVRASDDDGALLPDAAEHPAGPAEADRRFSATRPCWSIGIGGIAMTS